MKKSSLPPLPVPASGNELAAVPDATAVLAAVPDAVADPEAVLRGFRGNHGPVASELLANTNTQTHRYRDTQTPRYTQART
jgi:hypothetical protein